MAKFTVRPLRAVPAQNIDATASGLVIAALIVTGLYLGRDVFEPLAIAGLLGFILEPVIRRLRSLGLPKIAAVIGAVLLAVAVFTALSSTIVMQVSQLAELLPKYESNLRAKIHDVSGGALTSGALERASGTLKDLQTEIANSAPSLAAATEQKPLQVEVQQPPQSGFQSLISVMSTLVSPVAVTALTILFLVFILFQREDIRDRFLRLVGAGDLQRSTAALDDAAARLSRLFLMQTILNAGFGGVIAIGLWLIGVPNFTLWGILAGLLRFVPFIGSIVAAILPVALAAAVDPGWSMVLATGALFVGCETIAGNVLEPLLYGQHTGISPVAIVVAAMFWALLWGPIGLLLAMPLTVCLVVLGSHIDALGFIEILLSDEPALEPEERFYQRLLSANSTEAADEAEKRLKDLSLTAYYDAVPMKALGLAQADADAGRLPMEKQSAIRETMAEVVDALDDYDDVDASAVEGQLNGTNSASGGHSAEIAGGGGSILCLASHGPLDEAANLMLAQLLGKHGLTAAAEPFAASLAAVAQKAGGAAMVCISCLGAASNPAQVRYLIRRLKRRLPATKFVACYWLQDQAPEGGEELRTSVGADFIAGSLAQAVAACQQEAGLQAEPPGSTARPRSKAIVTAPSPAVPILARRA